MPFDVCLERTPEGLLRPASTYDAEQFSKFPVGHGVKATIKQVKPRSLQFHKMYFGGLLELAYQYWEPTGGLIGDTERRRIMHYNYWLARYGSDRKAMVMAGNQYLKELQESRKNRIATPESGKESLHRWVKRQAGYWRYVQTPTGIDIEIDSINFNAMDQNEFNAFYKAAFAVVWNFILSRSFKTQAEADSAINQLMSMG